MNTLTDDALLEIWLIGQARHPIDRSLLLLGGAYPDAAPDRLVSLSLGARNRALVEFRESMFGSNWQVVADCRNCGAALEFTLTDLVDALTKSSATAEPESSELRPLNSLDLAAIAAIHDPARARRELARRVRCLSPDDAERLTSQQIEETAEQLATIDPDAELLIEVDCPDCGFHWKTDLDLPTLVWQEIERAANIVLLDVVALASAFGWSESDILQMGSHKRQRYRELAAL